MKPILFNTEMVQAILDGRKTVTRRAVKPQPEITPIPTFGGSYRVSMEKNLFIKPPYHPSDILYVREAWALYSCNDRLPASIPCSKTAAGRDCYLYLADSIIGKTPCGIYPPVHRWYPSIHMPREAARLFLRVTDVRVERLQDITAEQCIAEGLERAPLEEVGSEFVRGMFSDIWDSTIKPADRELYGWAANPWVWVIEFGRIGKDEASRYDKEDAE